MIIRESARRRPGVIFWWFAFCFVSAGLFVLMILLQIHGLLTGQSDRVADQSLIENFGVPTVMALVYGVGPFLPRRRASWVAGILQMGISLLCSCGFCLPIAIPLLVFWCRVDTRQWFDRHDQTRDLAVVFD